MKNQLHTDQNELSPQWAAKFNQLTAYLDMHLKGITKIHWNFYRYKESCFSAMDMCGENGETFSLTLATGKQVFWPFELFEGAKKFSDADIQLVDAADIHDLVTLIIHQYKLHSCTAENNQLCFFRKTD